MLLLLDPYVDAILVLALAYLSLKIVQALFGPLTRLTGIGSLIASAEHAISQSLANACGTILHPIDIVVGGSLSKLASLFRRIAGVISSHARVLLESSELVAALALAYHGVRTLSHDLTARFHGIDAEIRSVGREFRGIEHRVKSLENDLTRGIGHDLRLSLQADEKALSHLERKVIPALRGDVATVEGEVGNLYDWAKGKAALIGVGTFSLAVAAALSALGFDWLKCKELGNLTQKRGCGLWSQLDKLLGLAGLLAVGFDFKEFVDAASEVAGGIGTFVGDLEAPFVGELPPLPPPQG